MKKAILFLLILIVHLSTAELWSQLRILGVHRVEHSIEAELKYDPPHTPDLSAWYQLFVFNQGGDQLPGRVKSILINNKSPKAWHDSGNLSWYGFPSEDPAFPEKIAAGSLMVWQFNGKDEGWLDSNKKFKIKTELLDTAIQDELQQVRMMSVVFTSDKREIYPNQLTIHFENNSAEDLRIDQVRLWLPKAGEAPQLLFPGKFLDEFSAWPAGRMIKKQSRTILQVSTGVLPLAYTAIEVVTRGTGGKPIHLWAYQKIKSEVFDISAGWANYPVGDRPGFLSERFLQTLQSLYINTAHYTGQKGYSDNQKLFSAYPLKYFGHLKPWHTYDHDSLLSRIHGVEILGEPQYGGGKPVDPQTVHDELKPYIQSRLTTTLTHSEERIWRYYAGLSDYPHYDAYRVTAPSADDWYLYDRWNGRRIRWGSPLETIGTMTRSLRKLNRPWPVAYWSQGPHEGWEVYGGRKRTSPTASELRAQAYHALSSGITSFYWFNLSYKSLAMYPELLEPMQRIGREIRLLESFYLTGAQWEYRRMGNGKNPQWDLSTFVAPEGVILFSLDLDYAADPKTRTFVFKKEREAVFTYRVPEWVGSEWKLLKIDANGIKEISFKYSDQQLDFSDRVSEVGIYAFVPSATAEQIRKKYSDLLQAERQWLFDPAKKSEDLNAFIQLGQLK